MALVTHDRTSNPQQELLNGDDRGESAVEGQHHAEQRRPELRLRKRKVYWDQRYASADVQGIESKEFEVDLMGDEEFKIEPVRVRLSRVISFWGRLWRNVVTLGLWELWHRFFATGSQLFDVEARLAITTRGRMLLWTHMAQGGRRSLCHHLCVSLSSPVGIVLMMLVILNVSVGPLTWGENLAEVNYILIGVTVFALLCSVGTWIWHRSSLTAQTSVRQFEVRDLSAMRLLCQSYRSWWGFGGEVLSCEVRMFFGFYPRAEVLRSTINDAVFDTRAVTPTNVVDRADGEQFKNNVRDAAGMSAGRSSNQAINFASAILLALAFTAFVNELSDYFLSVIHCVRHDSSLGSQDFGSCVKHRFRDWWTGSAGSGVQTVTSHYIDVADWSLQLILFFYTIAPAVLSLWKSDTHSSASLGFIIDRRSAEITEDERFEEHWEQLSMFLQELFTLSCLRPSAELQRFLDSSRESLDREGGEWWTEVPGDISEEDPKDPTLIRRLPSWSQIEEMSSNLLRRSDARVNVFTSVLAWIDGERILAVYPERFRRPIQENLKIILTCGMNYCLHWWRHRREGATILTDRRLIQISTHSARYYKSVKVDVYVTGCSVKYLAFKPPRARTLLSCLIWGCRRRSGQIVMTTHRGMLQIKMERMMWSRAQLCAHRFWTALTLLQDMPELRMDKLGDWADCYEQIRAQPQLDSNEEKEAMDLWQTDAWGIGGMAPRPLHGSPHDVGQPTGNLVAAKGKAAPEGGLEQVLNFGACQESWGIGLVEGEEKLWGPTLFKKELWRTCVCVARRFGNGRRPSALVTITNKRLIIITFRSFGKFAFLGLCYKPFVLSVASVPLRWVLGFRIDEEYSMQRAMAIRCLRSMCCLPLSASELTVKVLTQAGLGKVYPKTLAVTQRVLPRGIDTSCNFEEPKIVELRRWLGNVALWFSEKEAATQRRKKHFSNVSDPPPLDLFFKPQRGWSPE